MGYEEVFFSEALKIKNLELPGEEAHSEASPVERQRYLEQYGLPEDFREAAVMVWVVPRGKQAAVVLIKRSPDPGIHGGQISFPGGKKEEEDSDFFRTALRETSEEVGASPSEIELIRPLSTLYIPPSNFMVYPYLAFSTREQKLSPDLTEVDQILYLPLNYLMDDGNFRRRPVRARYGRLPEVQTLPLGEHIIWGATLMILSELRFLLRSIG